MKKFLFTLFIFLNAVNIVAQSEQPAIRAVFSDPGASYKPYDPNWCNSDSAFSLYKKLGYNTFIEFIPAPPPADWIKPSFIVKPEVRANLTRKIREQKERLNQIGLAYCPFYGEWGWGDKIGQIDERGKAMVYREVAIFSNYYGRDVYPRLRKTSGGWGDSSITTVWTQDFKSCTFNYNGPSNGCARIHLQTRSLEKQFKSLLPNHLINGQCYDVLFNIDLSNAKLLPGDYLRVYFFREYAKGQKPDPEKVPYGKLENIATDTKEVFARDYQVTSVSQDGYILNNSIQVKSPTVIQERIWIEPHMVCGSGSHRYDSLVRLDIELLTRNKSENANIEVSLQIKPVDPVSIVGNRQWETSKYYEDFLKMYPDEHLRETRADFDSTGFTIQRRLFLDSIPSNLVLTKIYGHFLPWNNDRGWSSLIQNPIDPLSPVAGLVNLEMLTIIRDGLDSVPPCCFCISSDEIPVFRRDYLSMKSGKAGTVYNKASNGEYFGRIVRNQIDCYKRVFGDTVGTAFIICGDMILPFGIGYTCIAEKTDDQNGLMYLDKTRGNDKIIIALWLYDYGGILKCPSCIPKEFCLKNASFVSENINRVKKHHLNFIAWYATDGKTSDLMSIDTGISDDTKHIQHEIDMARIWCDIVKENTDGFSGYLFCGWSPVFKANRWNGLYPLAYFGWKNPAARDFPAVWKCTSTITRGDNDQPVLDILQKGIVPW
jgi:hypothetical protein